ncbi:MAG: LuxR C-terminal-related transcriptional regulator [Planctomycetota bacterium]
MLAGVEDPFDLVGLINGLSFASVFLTDEPGYLRYIDQSTAKTFNLDANEVIGQRLQALIPPDVWPERLAFRQRVLAADGAWCMAIDMFHAQQVWHHSRVLEKRSETGDRQIITITVTPPVSAVLPDHTNRTLYLHVSGPGVLSSLTLGEAEVLRLLAMSKSQEEIAETLSRSVKAIERRRTLLGRKLGATSRSELAVIGGEAGLHRLTPDELTALARTSFNNNHPADA